MVSLVIKVQELITIDTSKPLPMLYHSLIRWQVKEMPRPCLLDHHLYTLTKTRIRDLQIIYTKLGSMAQITDPCRVERG
jgi:hypothetical protein